MILDLVVVRPNDGRAILAQLAADLGVSFHLVAEKLTVMEIFSVKVLTVRFDADAPILDATRAWFAQRGIHSRAAA